MILERVDFYFDNQTGVRFIGPMIVIIHDMRAKRAVANPWCSNRPENELELMGREFKPRVTDAKELLARYREKKHPFKPESDRRRK